MGRFLTGTTIECLKEIFKSGAIITNPPKRVWEDVSENFVYLVPLDGYDYNEHFTYCVEQSSFAVAELGGTKRVIIELELPDTEILADPDKLSFNSKMIDRNVSLSEIVAIHIEDEDNSEEIKELVAITLINQHDSFNRQEVQDMIWIGLLKEEIYEKIPVKNANYVSIDVLTEDEKFENRYMDLLENIDHGYSFSKYSLGEVLSSDLFNVENYDIQEAV